MITTDTLRRIIGLGITVSFKTEGFHCRTKMEYSRKDVKVTLEQSTPLDDHMDRLSDMLDWMTGKMVEKIDELRKAEDANGGS